MCMLSVRKVCACMPIFGFALFQSLDNAVLVGVFCNKNTEEYVALQSIYCHISCESLFWDL